MSAQQSATNRLDHRLIERCEAIPAEPPRGAYVVIDVLHFSNTVIELFANGAEYIHITDERGQEFAFKETTPEAIIGGGSTDEYTPAEGYDFFNSPSFVQRLDVEGTPVSMTSSNGGRAIATLRDRLPDGSDVYVGSTMNAVALGRHLATVDQPVYLVSAGSRGEFAVEDHVGATLISRYLDGIPPSETELDVFRRHVAVAKGDDYVERHELRRRDVHEFATNFNCRAVLPLLHDDSLIDVASQANRQLANPAIAD